jgi:hypothetical protein
VSPYVQNIPICVSTSMTDDTTLAAYVGTHACSSRPGVGKVALRRVAGLDGQIAVRLIRLSNSAAITSWPPSGVVARSAPAP